jgi:hypothetical protein
MNALSITGRVAAAAIVAVLISGCGGKAPTQPETATFRGVVHIIPTGPPIAGVTVTVQGKTAVTAADGTFTFTGLTTGQTNVTLAKEGFAPGAIQVTLNTGDNFFSLGMSAL